MVSMVPMIEPATRRAGHPAVRRRLDMSLWATSGSIVARHYSLDARRGIRTPPAQASCVGAEVVRDRGWGGRPRPRDRWIAQEGEGPRRSPRSTTPRSRVTRRSRGGSRDPCAGRRRRTPPRRSSAAVKGCRARAPGASSPLAIIWADAGSQTYRRQGRTQRGHRRLQPVDGGRLCVDHGVVTTLWEGRGRGRCRRGHPGQLRRRQLHGRLRRHPSGGLGDLDQQQGRGDERRGRPGCWVGFRTGIDVGPATSAEGDVHGEALNVAARIQAGAPPGGISVSGRVYRAIDEPALRFRAQGSRRLKYIPDSRPLLVLAAAQVELGLERRARAMADRVRESFPTLDADAWLARNPYQDEAIVRRRRAELATVDSPTLADRRSIHGTRSPRTYATSRGPPSGSFLHDRETRSRSPRPGLRPYRTPARRPERPDPSRVRLCAPRGRRRRRLAARSLRYGGLPGSRGRRFARHRGSAPRDARLGRARRGS